MENCIRQPTERICPSRPGVFDRDSLLLPDLLIDDLAVDLPSLLKPAFDAMWQASGWSRCLDYGEEGTWMDSRQRLVVGR